MEKRKSMDCLFHPVAFLLGVSLTNNGLIRVVRLIGVKVIEKEFVACSKLAKDPEHAHLSQRSKVIASYWLCGFGNLGSLGTRSAC
jgi:CNT family concentrative nucleoside transporter